MLNQVSEIKGRSFNRVEIDYSYRGVLRGSFSVYIFPDGVAEIWNLVIEERFRNMGFCKRMLREFKRKMKLKMSLLVLVSNVPAIKAYTDVGFRVTETPERLSKSYRKVNFHYMVW